MHAGLGLGTVSRALAEKARVAPHTRDRVLASARALGYRPNAAARALAGQRLRSHEKDQLLVAHLRGVADPADEFFAQACLAQGMMGICVGPQKFSSPRAASRQLRARGVDALVISPQKLAWSAAEMAAFDWNLFSVVVMARDLRLDGFEIVRHQAFDYMHRSLVNLREAGFRRIQVVLHRSVSEPDDNERLGAALAFQNRNKGTGGVRMRIHCLAGDLDHESMREVPGLLRDEWADVVLFDHYAFTRRLRDLGVGELLDRRPHAAAITTDQTSGYYGSIAGCLVNEALRFRRAVAACHTLIQTGRRGRCEHPPEHLIDPTWENRRSLLNASPASP